MSTEPRYHINVFWYPPDQCWIADVPDLRPCSARAINQPIPEPRYSPAIYAGA